MPHDYDNSGVDRRAAPRVDTPQIEGTLADRSGEMKCRISNLSRLGACAISNMALPEMTRVKVRFAIDDAESSTRSVACEAAVVRCQKRPDGFFDVGLFFTTMEAADRAAIERLAARGTPIAAR
jgi:hypothetical protein